MSHIYINQYKERDEASNDCSRKLTASNLFRPDRKCMDECIEFDQLEPNWEILSDKSYCCSYRKLAKGEMVLEGHLR